MISLSPLLPWRPAWRAPACATLLLPVFALVHFSAYWLRFEGQVSDAIWHQFTSTILAAVTIKVAVFSLFRIYQGWSRYVTFHDLAMLVKAVTVSSLLLLLFEHLLRPGAVLPRSVLLLDWGLALVVVGGLRSGSRFLKESARPALLSRAEQPVFIVGANDSGEALLRAIRRSPRLPYRVVGFLANDVAALRSEIGGVPVIGLWDQMCELARRARVSQVLITAGDLPGQRVRQLVDQAARAEVTVTVLPSYEQLIQGTVDLRPREVSIEDLLRRDPVQLDTSRLHHWLDDQVVLVTGSAGSIGSEICRQLLQFSPKRLIAVDRSETGQFFLERELARDNPQSPFELCLADLNDVPRMESLFQRYRPTIVFHAAAYKHVPLMETHPGEAVKNITLATCRLADLSETHGVKSFVMISTDKAVNPSSVMGACKRLAETYIQARAQESACDFVTVRFGNVLDSAGSVIPVFREQIARGGPVTVTHPDMERFFMTIPEASQLVIQAGAMGRGGEIFVLDMGEPVRVADLARDLIRLSGLRVGDDIALEYTGIRPGERLYEQLYGYAERHLPTCHPKIFVAEGEKTDLAVLEGSLSFLCEIVNGSAARILQTLHNIVPDYRTNDRSKPPVPVAERSGTRSSLTMPPPVVEEYRRETDRCWEYPWYRGKPTRTRAGELSEIHHPG